MMRARLFAPAKINLDLVITGTRADGYHTLRSHAVFADVGDDIVLTCAESDAPDVICDLSGPFAAQLKDLPPQDNLAVRAAQLFLKTHDLKQRVHIDLVKNLPGGAGLGGGSSDAAAIWRGLNAAFGKSEKPPVSLGADVPVCFEARPCLMEGIGDLLSPWETDSLPAILIWPGPGGSTKELYADFDAAQPAQTESGNVFETLAANRCPPIRDALDALRSLPGCTKAQLSGSGTAVFGLFENPVKSLPEWGFPWVKACVLGRPMKPLVTLPR